MTQDFQQAEDFVQEAFVRAMDHALLLENLKEQQRRSWLYRTIRNLYIDRIRHTSFELPVEEMPESENQKESEFFQVDYKQAMLQLSKEERILFIMRYLEGYNSVELGEIFDMPSGTVRAKLASARGKLKEILKD